MKPIVVDKCFFAHLADPSIWAAIEAGVKAEREECARIAGDVAIKCAAKHDTWGASVAVQIMDKIRERGNQ